MLRVNTVLWWRQIGEKLTILNGVQCNIKRTQLLALFTAALHVLG